MNVLKLVTGRVAVQIIVFLTAPVITRLYNPEHFGIFHLFLSVTAIIVTIASLRYESAIVLPPDEKDAVNIVALSSILVIGCSLMTLVGVALLGHSLTQHLGVPELRLYLWLVPLVVLTDGLLSVFSYYTFRRKQFGRTAFSGVLAGIVNAAVKIAIGTAGKAGPGGLIGAQILGSLIGSIVLIANNFKQEKGLLLANISIARMKRLASRYRDFPIYSSWSGLLSTMSAQMPLFFLAYYFSPVVVGFYALGYRMVRVPMGLIGGAISKVFLQKLSEERNKSGSVATVVDEVFKRLVSIGLFPTLVLTIIGKDFFVVVFGQNWAEAGVYLQYLAPWMFLIFITSPLSNIFSVLEKQVQGLTFNVMLFISMLIVLIVGGISGNPRFAIMLLALNGVVFWIWLCLWVMRLAGISPVKTAGHIAKSFFYSLPFLALAGGIKLAGAGSVLVVVGSTLAGILNLAYTVNRDKVLKEAAYGLLRRRRES